MAITVSKKSHFLIIPVALLLLFFSLLGYFGKNSWFFDFFGHLRWHYFWLGIILLIISLAIRPYKIITFIILVLSILINGYFVLPYVVQKPIKSNLPTFRALSVNLNFQNENFELLKSYISSTQPDFIFLFEFTSQWANSIKQMKDTYPFAKAIIRDDQFGIGIISKYPLIEAFSSAETIFEIPYLISDVSFGNTNVTLVAAHPFPPVSPLGKKSRDNYLRDLTSMLAKKSGPVLLCGDLNVTQWSSVFSQFSKDSNLFSAKGFGVLNSWPAQISPIGIQIDHCLASKHITFVNYILGPSIDSDHLPLQIEFVISQDRNISND